MPGFITSPAIIGTIEDIVEGLNPITGGKKKMKKVIPDEPDEPLNPYGYGDLGGTGAANTFGDGSGTEALEEQIAIYSAWLNGGSIGPAPPYPGTGLNVWDGTTPFPSTGGGGLSLIHI